MLELDHIAVLGETLDEAALHIEHATGLPMAPGGHHAHFATHNRMLGVVPQLYLEAIATDPGVPPPDHARWFGLDRFSGPARLDKWILRTDDMASTLEALPMAGRVVELQRGSLRWSMAVPEDGLLPFDGLFPAIIQWHVDVPPGKALPKPDLRLKTLTVSHPDIAGLEALLRPHLAPMPVQFSCGPAGLEACFESGGEEICLT